MSGKKFDMNEFLSGKEPTTENIQSEHIENTERTQKRDFKKHKNTKFDTFSIRLLPEDIERLRLYFDKRGLSLSQGIRTVVKDFMERQGV